MFTHLLVFTYVHSCFLKFNNVYSFLPMFTYVVLLDTHVCSCLPMISHVYLCVPQFTRVYLCVSMFTHVHSCSLIFTLVTYVQHFIRVYLFTRAC